MQLLLLNASVNWGELFEYGLAAAIVAAVFAIVLKPMVNQILKTNSDQAKSIAQLVNVISDGDRDIKADIKESEQRVIDRFVDLIEPNTIMQENIKEVRETLTRIEQRFNT